MKRFLISVFTPTFVSHCVGRVSRHKASGGTRCADLYYQGSGSGAVRLTYFVFYLCALPPLVILPQKPPF
ncbi:hypothetical protein H6G83_28165 [Anabaena azotica FACHB-119]|uniref:Uncharacterized protein n=1 Tax=Anabaena azotica FACHB-119 TaxID=947527 RepID=A0ABR8DB84_9NOST|nr:hypothetical protein [Anabaena azotica FACHB-119]